jgi:hypothetical protein
VVTLGGVSHVAPLPAAGEVFLDARGSGRALRVSWHRLGPVENDLVVLSLWRGGTCTATFRLPVEDVPDLVSALQEGLSAAFRDASGEGMAPTA